MGKIHWNQKCEICGKYYLNNMMVKRKCPKCREKMLEKLGFKNDEKKE